MPAWSTSPRGLVQVVDIRYRACPKFGSGFVRQVARHSMQEAGSGTRPELRARGGAPRRNRTGDTILTMDVLCRLS